MTPPMLGPSARASVDTVSDRSIQTVSSAAGGTEFDPWPQRQRREIDPNLDKLLVAHAVCKASNNVFYRHCRTPRQERT